MEVLKQDVGLLKRDVVVRGRLKTGEEGVLVAEVSHVVDIHDVKWAAWRARVVARALGIPAVSVVLGLTMTQGGRQAVEERHVLSVIVAEG
ncbi:MAG TPA: hypothetical protein EYH28_09215 [Anaerolineaceae bacterium]|nr:hypothetical protein [Anaerolineales bacterium]HIQ09663.1 hypothetical protein [Anaerolineaceae bacterium]